MFASALKKIRDIVVSPIKTDSQVISKDPNSYNSHIGEGVTPSENIASYNEPVFATSNRENEAIPTKLYLSDIAKKFDLSVRLNNILKNDDFPFTTVNDYLEAKDPFTDLKRVQNCGTKTAKEFEKYIGLACKFLSFFHGKNTENFNIKSALCSDAPLMSMTKIGFAEDDAEELLKFIFNSFKRYNKQHIFEVIEISLSIQYNNHRSAIIEDKTQIAEDFQFRDYLNNYCVPDCFLAMSISTRLENNLKNFPHEPATEKYKTLCDCAYDYKALKQDMARLRNYGRKTSEEFDNLFKLSLLNLLKDKGVSDGLSETLVNCFQNDGLDSQEYYDTISEINKQIDFQAILDEGETTTFQIPLLSYELTDEACTNQDILLEEIKSELNEKDFLIIAKRYGLGNLPKETLEEVAIDLNVTRERVRQLQSKILSKKLDIFQDAFEKFIASKHQTITDILFNKQNAITIKQLKSNINELDNFVRFALSVCYENETEYVKKNHQKYKNCWIRGDIENPLKARLCKDIDEYGDPNLKLFLKLKNILTSFKWPIEISSIRTEIDEFSIEQIITELENKFDASIQNEKLICIRKGLDANEKILIVFRASERAMSPEDTTRVYNEFFDENISAGTISNYLGSHPEALIVSRGLYNIYENLDITFDNLQKIRNDCYDFLNTRDIFISAGVLYQQIYMGTHNYGADFNKYMLYGILQDDNRFKYHRGLMVGLEHFSEDSFVGLNETLCKIVLENGPIAIKEIQNLLSDQRAVLDVTIVITLDSSADCIKVGPSQYDHISRVFSKDLSLENLNDTIALSLLDGPKTITAIKNTLSKLGICINTYPLISWIDKKEEFNRNKKIVSLIEIPEHLKGYISDFDNILENDPLKRELLIEKSPQNYARIVNIDPRLNLISSNDQNEDADDELDKILGDFGF